MTDTQTTAPGAPVAAKPRGNSVMNLLKFGPDPLEFMTELAQTDELGIVAVRTGNLTLRLITDPALIKRTIELDDPPTLGRGRFTRVASWYGGEGIFVKTSGPEHARQRDDLGRPIWNDPQTPGDRASSRGGDERRVARRRARRRVARVPPAALRDRLGAADGRAGRRGGPARAREPATSGSRS